MGAEGNQTWWATHRYAGPMVLFWLRMDSNYSELYLLTEEVMKENHTKPEVVMTEEAPRGNEERDLRIQLKGSETVMAPSIEGRQRICLFVCL